MILLCFNSRRSIKRSTSIYYDVEEPSVLETGSENLKNMINTFCGELEKNNYYCGVYASLNVFLNTFPAEIYQK